MKRRKNGIFAEGGGKTNIKMMYQRTVKIFIALLLAQAAMAQNTNYERSPVFNPLLKPFYHGVASGQPRSDGFVIWTRLTPNMAGQTNLNYYISETPDFQTITQIGQLEALPSSDQTARVLVTDLMPDRYYYYYFSHPEGNSLVGRAKTLPVGNVAQVRLAVASCARYESGYFNAYGAIAKRNDLDAVLFLGDYLYEYGPGAFVGDREVMPDHELLTLADYRIRYNAYHLDPDLMRMHQQHTVISIWDDHEFANGAYDFGAENHQANEGDWQVRKQMARQAYYEWLPLASADTLPIYAAYRFGNLADVLMLDTRADHRDQQPAHFDTPDIPVRHMVSDTQMQWLTNGLKNPDTHWKVIGNQVIFSDLNVGMFAGIFDGQLDPMNIDSIRTAEDTQTDFWEAYPTQRNAILDTIMQNGLKGVVIASGDSHSSWAFDLAKNPVLYPLPQYNYLPQLNPFVPGVGGYDPSTQAGSIGAEFCTPSVTTTNFDELIGTLPATILEQIFNQPVTPPNPSYNPHLKFADLDRHGYLILNLGADTAMADFFHVKTILEPNLTENYTVSAYSLYQNPAVHLAYTPSANKPSQALPTPTLPFGLVSTHASPSNVAIGGVFPNPCKDRAYLHLLVNVATDMTISVFGIEGKKVKIPEKLNYNTGVHYQPLDTSDWASGIYFIHLLSNGNSMVIKLVKE